MRYASGLLFGMLFALCLTGCTGGNTNIDPTELNDQLVEEFDTGALVSLPEDKVGELYGVNMERMDKYDVRVSMEGEEECELLVLKAKESEDADEAEKALNEAYGDRDATFSRSGVYLFAATGKYAKQMAEKFDNLTR